MYLPIGYIMITWHYDVSSENFNRLQVQTLNKYMYAILTTTSSIMIVIIIFCYIHLEYVRNKNYTWK